MKNKSDQISPPPEIGPYVFPTVLIVLGAWCLYDGFFSDDIEMQKYALFNQIAGGALVTWSLVDFYKTWKLEKKHKEKSENSV